MLSHAPAGFGQRCAKSKSMEGKALGSNITSGRVDNNEIYHVMIYMYVLISNLVGLMNPLSI